MAPFKSGGAPGATSIARSAVPKKGKTTQLEILCPSSSVPRWSMRWRRPASPPRNALAAARSLGAALPLLADRGRPNRSMRCTPARTRNDARTVTKQLPKRGANCPSACVVVAACAPGIHARNRVDGSLAFSCFGIAPEALSSLYGGQGCDDLLSHGQASACAADRPVAAVLGDRLQWALLTMSSSVR